MNPLRFIAWIPSLLLAWSLSVGCGHKAEGTHDHGKGEGHGHGEASSPGASFKPGEGIRLTEEIRKSLGVEIAEVTEHKLAKSIRFTAQVFGETHRHPLSSQDHSGCDAHGSGFVPADTAAFVKAGQPVTVMKGSNAPLGGVVLSVRQAQGLGETEIIIGVSNAAAALKPGEFLPARIELPREEAVPVVPRTALIRAADGAFVYVVNGDAYFRAEVQTGAETDGWVEITDGLLAGDQVVTTPVQTLWLIELRAAKGGGHSH